MSNAELIERLNKPCGRTTGHGESCSVGWLCGACADKAKAADALAAADKRIAELEKYGRVQDPLADRIAELERKLAVAREALQNGRTYLVRMALINAGMLMQSGEFTTLVNDSLDEFINDHLHEVSDSESPIAEFDWARITIRKMGEALAQIGGEDA